MAWRSQKPRLMAWDKRFDSGSMGRRRRVTRFNHEGDPSNFNNGTEAGHAKVENDGQLSFMEKLRNSMIGFARFELGHPLSAEEINLIELHLPKIFHAFQTPDHPPYSEMIYRAIEALDNEGGLGSSRDYISSYIMSHYQDLPWAHEHVFSIHLEKLVKTGEIVTNPIGSYSLPKNMKTPQLLLEHPCCDMDHVSVTDPDANSLAIVARDDVETKKPASKLGRTQKPKKVVNLKKRQRPENEGKTEEVAGEPKQAERRGRRRPRKMKNIEEKVEVKATKQSRSQCRR